MLRRDPSLSDADVAGYFGHFYELVMHDRGVHRRSRSTRRRPCGCTSTRTVRTAHVARASNVPPAFVITQRINLGLTAVLGRLHATANFRRIAEELWPFVAGPPSTPMGEAEAAWKATRPNIDPRSAPNRRDLATQTVATHARYASATRPDRRLGGRVNLVRIATWSEVPDGAADRGRRPRASSS